MTAVRTRVEVAARQALLTGLGGLMVVASRRVDRFRRPIGHFDISREQAFERAVRDQTDFLVRHLHPA